MCDLINDMHAHCNIYALTTVKFDFLLMNGRVNLCRPTCILVYLAQGKAQVAINKLWYKFSYLKGHCFKM